MRFTKDQNREVWEEEGIPTVKADSWFAKQETNNWTMPDGRKIKSPEHISRQAAKGLLSKMSVAEQSRLKGSMSSSEKKTEHLNSSLSPKDSKITEMFRSRMNGVGWVSDDGNPVVDKESYISFLAIKYSIKKG